MKQMVEAYGATGKLISVLEVPQDQVSSYGVIDPGEVLSGSGGSRGTLAITAALALTSLDFARDERLGFHSRKPQSAIPAKGESSSAHPPSP